MGKEESRDLCEGCCYVGGPSGSFKSAALKTWIVNKQKPFKNGLAGEEGNEKDGRGAGEERDRQRVTGSTGAELNRAIYFSKSIFHVFHSFYKYHFFMSLFDHSFFNNK